MAQGRHRAEPVRRPLPQWRASGVRVGALAVTLLVAAPAFDVLPVSGGDATALQAATVAGPADAPAGTLLEVRGGERSGRAAERSEVPVEAEEQALEQAMAEAAAVATPEPAPAPTPEPLPAVIGQHWATSAVNVRSGPSVDHERIGGLGAGDTIDITGTTEGTWTQVVLGGVVGWVSTSYLSATEPVAPAAAAVSGAACGISAGIESNLSANAATVYRAVCAAFGGSVSSFGGYRAGDSGDHGSGRALDIMVSGEPGWEIARFLQAHAAELHLDYVIYQQQIWMAGDPAGAWSGMSDRGSPTANHVDHVHVSVT